MNIKDRLVKKMMLKKLKNYWKEKDKEKQKRKEQEIILTAIKIFEIKDEKGIIEPTEVLAMNEEERLSFLVELEMYLDRDWET